MHDQRSVERMAGAIDQARGDQGRGIDVAGAQRLAAGLHDPDRITGLEGGQRRAGDVHFVAEHPEVAGAQPALFAAAKHQVRIVLGRGHGGHRR